MTDSNEARTETLSVAHFGEPACGSINPSDRVSEGQISDERVDQMAANMGAHYTWVGDRLMDQADVDAAFFKMFIPTWCVDGRLCGAESRLAPNAAGGTYSLVVGEALIDADALISSGKTSASHGSDLFKMLSSKGYDIGVHSDDHASGENCGCGACDKMGQIIGFLADNIGILSEKAAGLGVTIPDELQQKISGNAATLIENNYVSSGKDMNLSAVEATDESHNQELVGQHNEVVLVVNTVVGTTLNRQSLAEEYGEDYEAFNLDVWALKNGIDAISSLENEASEKFAAAVLYNLATACVLAGPSLRVVVR